ncbi:MAG: hypothetical protein WCA16_10880 [Candidatus Sulfotelmatobacter sp.]
MNRIVNPTKRVKTAEGLRYCPVVEAANGRIKPDVVNVNDREERHPEGGYYLDWTEGSKRVRVSFVQTPGNLATTVFCSDALPLSYMAEAMAGIEPATAMLWPSLLRSDRAWFTKPR